MDKSGKDENNRRTATAHFGTKICHSNHLSVVFASLFLIHSSLQAISSVAFAISTTLDPHLFFENSATSYSGSIPNKLEPNVRQRIGDSLVISVDNSQTVLGDELPSPSKHSTTNFVRRNPSSIKNSCITDQKSSKTFNNPNDLNEQPTFPMNLVTTISPPSQQSIKSNRTPTMATATGDKRTLARDANSRGRAQFTTVSSPPTDPVGNTTGRASPENPGFRKTAGRLNAPIKSSYKRQTVLSALVPITGWIYFFAWSISFYPQILLNFRRKSVTGLNFDFLYLNTIGFSAYAIYNVLLFYHPEIQERRGPPTLSPVDQHQQPAVAPTNWTKNASNPVLFNDVVFAVHALAACLVIALQCFTYERGTQRISYLCWVWSSLLLMFSAVALFIAIFGAISWLQFLHSLAYVKMAVTLSKYFPQAILNFKRKSTLGWSIGNILLDLFGGLMSVCQMVLQAFSIADWSAFSKNPVKFGLGFVSIFFDFLFIMQHYVLYREQPPRSEYERIPNLDATDPSPHSLGEGLSERAYDTDTSNNNRPGISFSASNSGGLPPRNGGGNGEMGRGESDMNNDLDTNVLVPFIPNQNSHQKCDGQFAGATDGERNLPT